MQYAIRPPLTCAILAVSLFVSACGSSGSDDPAPPPGSTTPDISVADVSVDEGGANNLAFSVTLSAVAAADVTADYSTADGTATDGQDYSAVSGSLTIPAGSTSASIAVPVINDSDDEADETLTVTLANVSANASLQRSQATGTITDDDPAPVLTIGDVSVNEGNAGTTNMSFQLSLSAPAYADVSVDYATSDLTAIAGQDYTPASGTASIAAGDLDATIEIVIVTDTDIEPDETLQIGLSNVSAAAGLGTATAIGTILNDDTNVVSSVSGLNDTGVTTCSGATANGLACNDVADGTDQFPGQDAEAGRDLTDNYDGDGYAGFVFTKLDSAGSPLVDQTVDYVTTPWDCVQDEVTGLLWEVKTDDGGLRDKDWTYSWYNSTGINDGGSLGASDGGQCEGTRGCDTENYTTAVNDTQLCNFGDWRLPTRHELLSLAHFGATAAPHIDTGYFANHALQLYWSSTPTTAANAAFVSYSDYGTGTARRIEPFAIRLVRGGQ